MRTVSPRRTTLFFAAVLGAALLSAPPAWAGCGCDHPPPAWSVVMPPFASPGRDVVVYADGFSFAPGSSYEVDFGGRVASVVASHADHVVVELPDGVTPGPVEIKVEGAGVDATYPDQNFTALAPPREIEDRSGVFKARNYEAAVGRDGTLYLALDVSSVLDAMQFTFALHELPLAFDAEDVVIYNADGVDLTLFELEVDDPTQRQWGSYYGWTVESDSNLHNTFYRPQSRRFSALGQMSNMFTYWRHEFFTYEMAHQSGGSHEVDAHGFHPDGTKHVDHGQLIIAIQGKERDGSAPEDLTKAKPLSPGKRTIDVGWVSLRTDAPAELTDFTPLILASTGFEIENLFERDDDDDD